MKSVPEVARQFIADMELWYEAQRKNGAVNRNVMAVGLIMCEHMRSHFPFDETGDRDYLLP